MSSMEGVVKGSETGAVAVAASGREGTAGAGAGADGRPLRVPEGCDFSLADLEGAIRVGEALKKSKEIYEHIDLRPLRKAWGPLIGARAREIATQSSFVSIAQHREATARANRRKAHDRNLIETRRLRAARRMQLEALQANANTALAAIPDGTVDDGMNTSFGQSGGTETTPQILLGTVITDGNAEDFSRSSCSSSSSSSNNNNSSSNNNESSVMDDGRKERSGRTLLHRPRSCYACKVRFFELHEFYDQLCPDCAELNWRKRLQTADLSGYVALLTGGRVKIGYQSALKLLRAGCFVHVTSRFVADAALRFSKERDFDQWRERLKLHGMDFRDVAAVERFASHLATVLPRLDVIINNACQTIRRPPLYYRHLLANEQKLLKEIAPAGQHFENARNIIDNTKWHDGGGGASPVKLGDVSAGAAAAKESVERGFENPVAMSTNGNILEQRRYQKRKAPTAAEMTQISSGQLTPEDEDKSLFPASVDVNGTQIDLRKKNSWLLTLSDVSTPELLEVLAINTVAPAVLNARLKALMIKSRELDKTEGRPDRGRYIINVSAMEGKFYRHKSANHPHTNCAKAALNMITRTSAEEYAAEGIYMNSVDTGWINDENPLEQAARTSVTSLFQTPIDEMDAAARVLDPVLDGVNSGKRLFGKFLKDYRPSEW